jgi:hypothetical protein
VQFQKILVNLKFMNDLVGGYAKHPEKFPLVWEPALPFCRLAGSVARVDGG